MSISEFRDKINLIMSFAAKVNVEILPGDIKKTMVKIYANTLKINLSDGMVESIFKITDAYA